MEILSFKLKAMMNSKSQRGACTKIDHSMLCSSQDHLRTGTRNLDHPVLAGAKNTNSWRARMGDLQGDFPLDVLMVPSSMITIAADGERLTCGGFSLGETIHLGNFELIADYFGSLSLSPGVATQALPS
jgi:hypothetical protein